MLAVDFDRLYAEKNNLTPLESKEKFILEQQQLRVDKQHVIRRRRACLPAEKRWTWDMRWPLKNRIIL